MMIRLLGGGTDPAAARRPHTSTGQPFYARMLRLRHIHPGGVLCFLFCEATITLAILLALAELVPWIAIPVLPLTVATLVKVNDLIVGASARGQARRPFTALPAYAMGGGYPPIVRALEAVPARPVLYGTPLALPPGRSSGIYGTPLALPPARGVATVEAPPRRPTSTVYGSGAALAGDVPTARGGEGGRHTRPTGIRHYMPHR